jgi:hypothetical protein
MKQSSYGYKKIVHVGVDVDDTAFHGAGIIHETGELFEFQCKPDAGVLRKKLREVFGERYEIHLCYEACYLGYTLYRFLRKAGIHCDVIVRDIVRSRHFLVQQRTMLKTHVLTACKRLDIKFIKTLWTDQLFPGLPYQEK